MINLTPILPDDLEQVREWIQADPWHKDDYRHSAEFLLTGNGLLTFCLMDDKGPLCFVRLDAEGEMLRLATQFGPESEVSRKRLIVGLLSMGIPAIVKFGKDRGFKGIVFESTSESLIAFMDKQGFKAAGGDDYALTFEGNNV